MDTRSKIVSSAGAAAHIPRLLAESGNLKLIRGAFDPLLSWHVNRLREIAGESGEVVVLLCDPEKPILNSRARAELAAGLGIVKAVVLPPEDPNPGWLQGLPVPPQRPLPLEDRWLRHAPGVGPAKVRLSLPRGRF